MIPEAKRLRIPVTGFGPFPGVPRNPSAEVACAVARKRRFAAAGIDIVCAILPTEYREADRQLMRLLAERPDAVVMFGVAGRSREIRIETLARNAASVLHPDGARFTPSERRLVAEAHPSLPARAPFNRILAAVRAVHGNARLSRDAGRYLCNAALFRALHETKEGDIRVAVFVHIPMPRRAGRRRALKPDPRPSLPALVRAGEAAVWAAAMEAGRARPVPKRHD